MPLINAIVYHALFHSKSYMIHPSDAASNRSYPVLFLVDCRCPRFYNEIYFRQSFSVGRNLEVHTDLLHYCTFGLEAANDARFSRVDTARGKDNDQQNI